MEKKYIHYKKVEGNFGIEIDESVARKYIKLKKEIKNIIIKCMKNNDTTI